MSHAPPGGYHACPTCGVPLQSGATVCSACGLPLPAPQGMPQRAPRLLVALALLGVLYLGFVAWYAVKRELVEARQSQMRQDMRLRD